MLIRTQAISMTTEDKFQWKYNENKISHAPIKFNNWKRRLSEFQRPVLNKKYATKIIKTPVIPTGSDNFKRKSYMLFT